MKTAYIRFIEIKENFLFAVIAWISTIDSLLYMSKLKAFETKKENNDESLFKLASVCLLNV